MPRKSASKAAAEPQELVEEDEGVKLQFHEPLSWRAGRPIAIADLLKRLQSLSKELEAIDQEICDKDSFTPVARELAHPNLLTHKDNGVKAWTACCLVDMLRVCAPDAPYTGEQLKDIFQLIIGHIIPSLVDPANAYYQQQLYVLKSLAEVKSIVLIVDIPSSDRLTTQLFSFCFDAFAGSHQSSGSDRLAQHVEMHLSHILVTLVEESQNLPSEVIDVIVAQFLRTDPRIIRGTSGKSKKAAAVDETQSTLGLKEFPPPYILAKTICNACADRMARYVSQYFSDVVVDASSSAKGSSKKPNRRITEEYRDAEADNDGTPSEEDLRELEKVHQLLRELWRASPAMLQNIIPQLDAELSADNVSLRLMATETFGDMISGIGSAGIAPQPTLDPAAYPPASLSEPRDEQPIQNVLTKPSSPQPFSQVHPTAYNAFLGRVQDKSPAIRAAWATAVGRILTTSAGGVGLNRNEEDTLTKGLATSLRDADEKVRLAAVKAVESFDFQNAFLKLGASGGLSTPGTVLAVLGDRVRDLKAPVRKDAIKVLARLWGAATGEIASNNEQVLEIIGPAPSKILLAHYTNDTELNALIDRVLFEELIPLSFPPTKTKGSKTVNGDLGHGEGHESVETAGGAFDPDRVRVQRILLMVKSLEDDKAKKVFLAMQQRQPKMAQIMEVFLTRCEEYNGGVTEGDEHKIKAHLDRLILNLARGFPDSKKVEEHLWKFVKLHDRRSYQLIRYCIDPESDYRKVYKALKELCRRLPTLQHCPQDILSTITPLMYRISLFVYNKTHVPAIMDFARSDEKSLAASAHELLREISTQTPQILKAHIKDICLNLQREAPSPQVSMQLGSLDDLKACAAFAAKFPGDVPGDRAFVQAIQSYALYGKPAEAAKHAVTILMTTPEKREMRANDLLKKCIKGFKFGEEGFVSRLASLAQLTLLAPDLVNEESDSVSSIAIEEVLLQTRQPSEESEEAYEWSETVDDELEAKCWALKILVNRVRSHADRKTLVDIATPIYKLLYTCIHRYGEMLPGKNTPPHHKSRLRLLAARLCLKLALKKHTDDLISPEFFNVLALVAQDSRLPVRVSFLERLKKYLSRQKLGQRYYTIPFLLAFEPSTNLKNDSITWIRNRVAHFDTLRSQQESGRQPPAVFESVFARLLSLLAHHPDFSTQESDLLDAANYVAFYLQTVASSDSVSLIYHIALRVKACTDAISKTQQASDNLYNLSDLAQLTIHKMEEARNWNIQTLPARVNLPRSLFSEIQDHEQAQKIAERNFLPENIEEGIEKLVKRSVRSARNVSSNANPSVKKRRSEAGPDGSDRATKKAKPLAIRKAESGSKGKAPSTSKSKKAAKSSVESGSSPSAARRRSGRVSENASGKYAERDDDEDDEEMGEGVAQWRYEKGDNGGDDMEEDEAEDNIEADGPDGEDDGEETKDANEDEDMEDNDPEADDVANGEESEEEDANDEDKDKLASKQTAKSSRSNSKKKSSSSPASSSARPGRGRRAAAVAGGGPSSSPQSHSTTTSTTLGKRKASQAAGPDAVASSKGNKRSARGRKR